MGLRVISICTSDYFQGCSKPVLAVPVHCSMNVEAFLQAVGEQYNAQDDFPEIDIDKELQLFGEHVKQHPFDDLDPSTDDGEGEFVYAYVVYAE